MEKSDSATLILGLPHNFGMKPILLNGGTDSSFKKVKASSKIETGNSGVDHGLSSNEVRHRRQTERDCGLQDMVTFIFKKNFFIQNCLLSLDFFKQINCFFRIMEHIKQQLLFKPTIWEFLDWLLQWIKFMKFLVIIAVCWAVKLQPLRI